MHKVRRLGEPRELAAGFSTVVGMREARGVEQDYSSGSRAACAPVAHRDGEEAHIIRPGVPTYCHGPQNHLRRKQAASAEAPRARLITDEWSKFQILSTKIRKGLRGVMTFSILDVTSQKIEHIARRSRKLAESSLV